MINCWAFSSKDEIDGMGLDVSEVVETTGTDFLTFVLVRPIVQV